MSAESNLLGRDEHLTPDEVFVEAITGKRILVTGAGGSIGSEVASRIAACFPEHLSLVTNTESHLYEISYRISQERPGLAFSSVLCDVRDIQRVEDVLSRENPDVIFHCAALKHIPLVESNPCEGVLTNILGTKHVVDAGIAAGASRIVFLSTDKAVSPTSVMGMSKRVAELYCLSVGGVCRVARLVNVLGSSGSVLPLFRRQAAEGIPLTVTHQDMARYFITLQESADYLLQAAVIEVEGTGIFVPDMGPPTRIMDLAQRVIDEAGVDLPAPEVTGIRPGEKLDEDLFYPFECPENVSKTVLFAPSQPEELSLEPLFASARAGHGGAAVDIMRLIVGSR